MQELAPQQNMTDYTHFLTKSQDPTTFPPHATNFDNDFPCISGFLLLKCSTRRKQRKRQWQAA